MRDRGLAPCQNTCSVPQLPSGRTPGAPRTRTRAGDITSSQFFQRLDLHGAAALCLSDFAGEPQAQVRYLYHLLRRRWLGKRAADIFDVPIGW